MNYRIATILAVTTVSTDYTEDIDIDVKDPISQLVICYDELHVGSGTATGHPAECVTKIELIDGSNVLYSLSGVEAQAVDYYHNRVEPANRLRYLNNNYAYMVFNINFGRYLYDPELALDPARFSNLKLRVTIDRNAGGTASVAGRLRVLAHLFDQKVISPIGFLMHKEIKSYTLGDSSHEYTDLPLDYPYRKLFIRGQRDEYSLVDQIDNIKLSEDGDKRVPFNQSSFNLVRAVVSQSKPYREGIIGAGHNTGRYYFCTPCHNVTFAGSQWRSAHQTDNVPHFWGGNGGYFKEIQVTGAGNFACNLQGWLPHAVLEIPFGLQNEIVDWYDVSGIGNLKLDITGGAAVDTHACQIMLQQLRRY